MASAIYKHSGQMVRIIIWCVFQKKYERSYFFWTYSMPKLNRRSSDNGLSNITDDESDEYIREHITKTYKAMEGFALFNCIGMGLLQLSALKFSDIINKNARWLRTYSSNVPSEETTAVYLRGTLSFILSFHPDLVISQIIRDKRGEFNLDLIA